MSYALQGVFLGSTYAVVAIGFVIIYTAIKTFQFAHGALVALAAYIFLDAYTHTQSIWLALAIVMVSMGAISVVVSMVAFEPLIGKHVPSLITGLGIAIIIDEVLGRYFFGGLAMSYPASLRLSGTFTIGGVSYVTNNLLVFGVAAVAVIVLDRFFRRSRAGMEMRALSDTADGARICGISVTRTVRLAFLVAGVSAALAGMLLGLLLANISPTLGDNITIKAVAAVLLAGPTSLRGAAVAALLIGMTETLATGYLSSSYSSAAAYGVIIIVLLMKPRGMFGQPA